MNHKHYKNFFYGLLASINILQGKIFIADENQLNDYIHFENLLMIASSGRSGSAFLTSEIVAQDDKKTVLKAHLLPTFKNFRGKIIFIYSNPDKAAESALHATIKDPKFGFLHFYHMKSSDLSWLQKIGSTDKQNLRDNLLTYDALGYTTQLEEWLIKTKASNPIEAQILAIKYENLWDDESICAIREFLKMPNFQLSPKLERGDYVDCCAKEKKIKMIYNHGTKKNPCYSAYDKARKIWIEAPPTLYLNLST